MRYASKKKRETLQRLSFLKIQTIKKDVKELGIYDRDLKIIRDREFDSKLYYKE